MHHMKQNYDETDQDDSQRRSKGLKTPESDDNSEDPADPSALTSTQKEADDKQKAMLQIPTPKG